MKKEVYEVEERCKDPLVKLEGKMEFMTQSFDAFRIHITSQYVESTKKQFEEVKRDQHEISSVIENVQEMLKKVDWKMVGKTEDIINKATAVLSDF